MRPSAPESNAPKRAGDDVRVPDSALGGRSDRTLAVGKGGGSGGILGRMPLIAAFFFVLVLGLKFPILNTPHYWDALNRVHNADWVMNHGFNPFLEKGGGLLNAQGRPPFFFELLALTWTIFGRSLPVTHLVIIGFSFLGLLFTYLLGRRLAGAQVGFWAAVLLFFSPLYFAQSGLLNYEIPLTALSMMTVYFAFTRKRLVYLISAACLVLTKETGMLILLPVVLVVWLRHRKNGNVAGELLWAASPVLAYLAWLIACRIYLGWFLFPSHLEIINLSSPLHLVRVFLARSSQMFFKNGHVILSLVIFLTVPAWVKRLRAEKTGVVLVAAGLASYLVFFSFYPIPLDRYLLPVYPLFFLLFFWSLAGIGRRARAVSALALIVVVPLFIVYWTGHRNAPGSDLESNMEYLDFIEVHADAVRYLKANFPGKRILTDWPQTMELRYPFEGYTGRPLQASSIFEEYDPREVDLFYFVPTGVKEFADTRDRLDLVLLARFEKKGKEAMIYQIRGVAPGAVKSRVARDTPGRPRARSGVPGT